MSQRHITKATVLKVAADMLGPDSDTVNPEYSRAVYEMTAELVGVPQDDKDDMIKFIKMLAE